MGSAGPRLPSTRSSISRSTRRKVAVGLFLAATFGGLAVLSLPVGRVIQGRLHLPSPIRRALAPIEPLLRPFTGLPPRHAPPRSISAPLAEQAGAAALGPSTGTTPLPTVSPHGPAEHAHRAGRNEAGQALVPGGSGRAGCRPASRGKKEHHRRRHGCGKRRHHRDHHCRERRSSCRRGPTRPGRRARHEWWADHRRGSGAKPSSTAKRARSSGKVGRPKR
jgi:hypothetical protein